MSLTLTQGRSIVAEYLVTGYKKERLFCEYAVGNNDFAWESQLEIRTTLSQHLRRHWNKASIRV